MGARGRGAASSAGASVLAAERLIERSKQVVCGVVRVSTTIRLCELEKKMMIDDELCM